MATGTPDLVGALRRPSPLQARPSALSGPRLGAPRSVLARSGGHRPTRRLARRVSTASLAPPVTWPSARGRVVAAHFPEAAASRRTFLPPKLDTGPVDEPRPDPRAWMAGWYAQGRTARERAGTADRRRVSAPPLGERMAGWSAPTVGQGVRRPGAGGRGTRGIVGRSAQVDLALTSARTSSARLAASGRPPSIAGGDPFGGRVGGASRVARGVAGPRGTSRGMPRRAGVGAGVGAVTLPGATGPRVTTQDALPSITGPAADTFVRRAGADGRPVRPRVVRTALAVVLGVPRTRLSREVVATRKALDGGLPPTTRRRVGLVQRLRHALGVDATSAADTVDVPPAATAGGPRSRAGRVAVPPVLARTAGGPDPLAAAERRRTGGWTTGLLHQDRVRAAQPLAGPPVLRGGGRGGKPTKVRAAAGQVMLAAPNVASTATAPASSASSGGRTQLAWGRPGGLGPRARGARGGRVRGGPVVAPPTDGQGGGPRRRPRPGRAVKAAPSLGARVAQAVQRTVAGRGGTAAVARPRSERVRERLARDNASPGASPRGTGPQRSTGETGPVGPGRKRTVRVTGPVGPGRKRTVRVTGPMGPGRKRSVTSTVPVGPGRKRAVRVTGPVGPGRKRSVTSFGPSGGPSSTERRGTGPAPSGAPRPGGRTASGGTGSWTRGAPTGPRPTARGVRWPRLGGGRDGRRVTAPSTGPGRSGSPRAPRSGLSRLEAVLRATALPPGRTTAQAARARFDRTGAGRAVAGAGARLTAVGTRVSARLRAGETALAARRTAAKTSIVEGASGTAAGKAVLSGRDKVAGWAQRTLAASREDKRTVGERLAGRLRATGPGAKVAGLAGKARGVLGRLTLAARGLPAPEAGGRRRGITRVTAPQDQVSVPSSPLAQAAGVAPVGGSPTPGSGGVTPGAPARVVRQRRGDRLRESIDADEFDATGRRIRQGRAARIKDGLDEEDLAPDGRVRRKSRAERLADKDRQARQLRALEEQRDAVLRGEPLDLKELSKDAGESLPGGTGGGGPSRPSGDTSDPPRDDPSPSTPDGDDPDGSEDEPRPRRRRRATVSGGLPDTALLGAVSGALGQTGGGLLSGKGQRGRVTGVPQVLLGARPLTSTPGGGPPPGAPLGTVSPGAPAGVGSPRAPGPGRRRAGSARRSTAARRTATAPPDPGAVARVRAAVVDPSGDVQAAAGWIPADADPAAFLDAVASTVPPTAWGRVAMVAQAVGVAMPPRLARGHGGALPASRGAGPGFGRRRRATVAGQVAPTMLPTAGSSSDGAPSARRTVQVDPARVRWAREAVRGEGPLAAHPPSTWVPKGTSPAAFFAEVEQALTPDEVATLRQRRKATSGGGPEQVMVPGAPRRGPGGVRSRAGQDAPGRRTAKRVKRGRVVRTRAGSAAGPQWQAPVEPIEKARSPRAPSGPVVTERPALERLAEQELLALLSGAIEGSAEGLMLLERVEELLERGATLRALRELG